MSNGDTVLPSQHNPPLQDIASALTGSLNRGGLGAMLAPIDHGGYRAVNLAPGTSDTDAATVGQLANIGVPIGVPLPYAGPTAPEGWILCYGQAVSRALFPLLFVAIGTAWGVGDGSTTFNVPDFRGRTLAGKDDMGGASAGRLSDYAGTTLGAGFGTQSHTLTVPQIPVHDHGGLTAIAGDHTHAAPFLSSPSGGQQGAQVNSGTLGAGISTTTAGAHQHTIAGQGGGGSHPNVQPTAVVNWIVRAA